MALPLKPKPPILSNIWPLFDGKTVIVVTHRLAAIEDLVDEVVAIQEGRVAARPIPLGQAALAAPDPAGC
jgi:ABC-type transport system involved in cytochrome bd biosynthesis fused ATPase/permease subunit